MSHAAELTERHTPELRRMADSLPDLFAKAAGALEEPLGQDGLLEWARSGMALARRSPRTPEVPLAFFEASPVVGRLESVAISSWAELAAELAERAPPMAVAFIEATPAALARLEPEQLVVWARQGQRLSRGGWKSARLAARFFRLGPGLLASVSLPALERLVDVLGRLAQSSHEMASSCLRDAPSLLTRLAESDRDPFLAFTQAVSRTAWADTHSCFERGPDLIEAVRPDQRAALLALAAAVARRAGGQGFSLFVAAAEALGTLGLRDQAEVVELAQRLAIHDARAAIESVVSAPEVRRRLKSPQARRWTEAGLELLTGGESMERAESYFRLESSLAEEMLAAFTARVELSRVGNLLRLYAKALSGEPLPVQPTDMLVDLEIGWATRGAATSDGRSIFLPLQVDLFDDAAANFEVYKVHTTHQVGRLEFGSFRYCFGVAGEHLASTVFERERQRRVPGESVAASGLTAMQRLYDLFDDRRLLSQLFALAEDARIDARVCDEYPGIRRGLRRLQKLEAEQRPEVRLMPMRQAFVENLLRASLGQPETIRWPKGLAVRLEQAVAALRVMERAGATVQDSAELATRLYDLAIVIPNLPPRLLPGDWDELDEAAVSQAARLTGARVQADEALPEGPEVPYESPQQPEYRGDFKPELVQLLDELTDRENAEQSGAPLTQEQILELLEQSPELAERPDDRSGELDALLAGIEREAADRTDSDDDGGADGDGSDQPIEWFRYDEWDFQAGDYRPGWCRVGERTAAEGELDFYQETLQRYHGLVVETRRQFECMRPESLRLQKRLEDGLEIDFDRAIEFHADKKAGAGPLAQFYTRRNKIERDVAVAFVLDMSGSTSEEIPQPAAMPRVAGGARTREQSAASPRGENRIIDVERESAVLVVEALEAIGDAYGLYGFSGHGRENVEFHVFKHIDEPFDDAVRRRIEKIEPISSTRMGPAIRHTIRKLNDHNARVKILILVSDGRPQDEDYGRDRSQREYAVHDTRRALLEAKRQSITPFLITIDSAGHDYLRGMCDDIGYEVVADIESLPRRLPRLYRHLTAG